MLQIELIHILQTFIKKTKANHGSTVHFYSKHVKKTKLNKGSSITVRTNANLESTKEYRKIKCSVEIPRQKLRPPLLLNNQV